MAKAVHRKGSKPPPEPDDPDAESGPRRRCLVSGEVKAKGALLRFVVDPDGVIAPDLDESLPGRGLWLSAGRDVVETATARKLFARAARAQVVVPADLPDRIEAMLRRRCLATLGLLRRAGAVATGFDLVKAASREGRVALFLEAADGAADGRRKVTAGAQEVPLVDEFSAAELAAALGRDHVVHVAVLSGGGALRGLLARMIEDLDRLRAYRGPPV